MSGPIRVLLADDQDLVRGAIAALLTMEDDISVVAQVGRGDEVVDLACRLDVDVALLDAEMPGMDGIAATRHLAHSCPAVRAMIVTTFGRPGYLRRALEAGAVGFVVKDTPSQHLADAVRRVHRGERVVDPLLAAQALTDGPNPLTDRETDVLRVSLDGRPVRDIAATLHLSEGTVRNYLSSAIDKTSTATRGEAATVARDRGWL